MNFLQKIILTSAAISSTDTIAHIHPAIDYNSTNDEFQKTSGSFNLNRDTLVTTQIPGYLSKEMCEFIKPEMRKRNEANETSMSKIISSITDGELQDDQHDLKKLSSILTGESKTDNLTPISLFFAQENSDLLMPGPGFTATGTYKVTFGATDQAADVDG